MKNLADAASLAALDPGLAGAGAMPEAPLPPDLAAAPAEGGLEAGISMIEQELGMAPPDLAEEARTHLNALRDIAAKIGGGGEALMEEAPPAEEPPVPMPGEEV